jgi:hypothetical protein
MAYRATVVLIESSKSLKSALPVKKPAIYMMPFRQPLIYNIMSQTAAGDPIVENQKVLATYRLVIVGRQLKSDRVKVCIDNNKAFEVIPAEADVNDAQITFTLPEALPAGLHGLQVIQEIPMGEPALPHQGVSSNIDAFVLSPVIKTNDVINVKEDPISSGLVSASISLTVEPAIHKTQRVILLLNEITKIEGATPFSYSFPLSMQTIHEITEPANNITVPIKGVRTGDYLLRVEIDGAQSPLHTDASGKYISPQVSLSVIQ